MLQIIIRAADKMEMNVTKGKIEFEKRLNSLDDFVIDFTAILNKIGIKYVIVSGYVSILFGRNRSSEDIDIIMERVSFAKFRAMCKALSRAFECINALEPKEAYDLYLLNSLAIRFARKNKIMPNVELKFPHAELDDWTLAHRKKVVLNGKIMFISPIELQIPFKLFLGSEKDIEDAKYLYGLFKKFLDLSLLQQFNRKLKIEKTFNAYLR